MGFFHHESDEAQAWKQYDEYDPSENKHEASLTHEVLAGAAAYEAAKAYEKYCSDHGKPSTHAKAIELLAGFTGAFIDREVETKGLDYIDQHRAKADAKKKAHEAFEGNDEYKYRVWD